MVIRKFCACFIVIINENSYTKSIENYNEWEKVYNAINFAMVQAYRQIGRIIVEHEQNGSLRADYGKAVLQEIFEKLQQEFGSGFSVRKLQQMKKFYALFPNTNALRSQLTWTHYRALLRVENDNARNWYMEECIRSNTD